ncbi:hypothetical protein BC1002_6548 [Paraburkholderia atlantica]|uniref:Uncharacterized protein n=1 Tax=Paraburkholderia atlantica TaxID=2654982 RepID=D5WME3_PARAM|nr:hypothetical protein [Paraburkholderia atlantica]ADG20389.1 hypothetical protein BC1002_6548 [Paraburkholderia atlantica]
MPDIRNTTRAGAVIRGAGLTVVIPPGATRPVSAQVWEAFVRGRAARAQIASGELVVVGSSERPQEPQELQEPQAMDGAGIGSGDPPPAAPARRGRKS